MSDLLELFEELGKAMNWNEIARQKWTNDVIARSTFQTPILSFLDFASLFSLRQYVLDRVPKLKLAELDSLLKLLLPVKPYATVPPPLAEIVSVILSYGVSLDSLIQNHEVLTRIHGEDTVAKHGFDFDYSTENQEDLNANYMVRLKRRRHNTGSLF